MATTAAGASEQEGSGEGSAPGTALRATRPAVVVLFADAPYLDRAIETVEQVRRGGYHGDVAFFTNPATAGDARLGRLAQLGAGIRVFPEVPARAAMASAPRGAWAYPTQARSFQAHKTWLAAPWVRAWDRVLYLDAGMRVYGHVGRLLALLDASALRGRLLAHSNVAPDYQYGLEYEFDGVGRDASSAAAGAAVFHAYPLASVRDYFQSTLLLFTPEGVIEDSTVARLHALLDAYGTACRHNDQGVWNLHFLCERSLWTPLPLRDHDGALLYDFWERGASRCTDYVALKYPRTDPRYRHIRP